MKDSLLLVGVGAMYLVPIAALITHVVFCIIFPVGILHGISLWLGYTWI